MAMTAIAGVTQAYAGGDLAAVCEHTAKLCGLGLGLTPSGDDWLAGWLVGMRLRPSARDWQATGQAILAVAQQHTNLISLAFLQCAARGQTTVSWH